MAPYSAQLTALSKVPPGVFPYLKAHATAVTTAAAQAPGQWRDLVVGVLRRDDLLPVQHPAAAGPLAAARRHAGTRHEHEAMVQAELAKLKTSRRHRLELRPASRPAGAAGG